MNHETGSQSQTVKCQYISLKGLAVLLDVPYETTRKWRARGELPHSVVLPNGQIRMSLADVDLWLEGRAAWEPRIVYKKFRCLVCRSVTAGGLLGGG